MPIFTRILDFKRAFLARLRDKRRHARHRVGQDFPLKASLSLVGSANFNPDRAAMRGGGVHWSGAVGNISDNGLSIILSPAATTARGEPTVVRLTLESHELAIPCTVAHFRVYNSHAHCGVQLAFDDFKSQKAYLQLVEAVKLGAAFAPAGPGRSHAGLVSRTWRSVNRAHLTEWRETGSRALERFELTLGEHTVQGEKTQPGLAVHHRAGSARPVPADAEGEVRQLFRWVVGNLPKTVPADLRAFMARAGGNPPTPPTPPDWRAPVTAVAFTSTVIKVPPSVWQAPKPKVGADTVA